MEEDKNAVKAEEEKTEEQSIQAQENAEDAQSEKEPIQDSPAKDIEIEETVSVEDLDTAPIAKAEEWLRLNDGNLKYLNSNKVQRLKEIVQNPELVDADSLAVLQKLHAELENELEKKFYTKFNEAKNGLVKLREEMFKIPNYDNLPDQLQEVALNTFTNCELRLSNTRLIDELSEIFENFKNVVYPDLSQKIYALENPNVLPINLIEVMDSMPKLSFGTEEELDSALKKLRAAAVIRLNKSKPKE